jgi:hypothetical protein
LSTTISIGGALSKEGGKALKQILETLNSPGGDAHTDLFESLSETQQKVLFGETQIERQRNPDTDTN